MWVRGFVGGVGDVGLSNFDVGQKIWRGWRGSKFWRGWRGSIKDWRGLKRKQRGCGVGQNFGVGGMGLERCFIKMVLLKIWQNLLENTCAQAEGLQIY